MKKLYLKQIALPLLFIFGLANNSWAQTIIADWNFSAVQNGAGNFGGPTYAAAATDPNVTVGLISRGGGFQQGSNTGAAAAWGASNFSSSVNDEASAIAAGQYTFFTFTANTGYKLSLSTIDAYNIRRSNTGPNIGIFQYQVGSGSFTDIGLPITWGGNTTSSGNPQNAIDLSGIPDLQNVPTDTTITFRIILWGATGSSGTWYINSSPAGSPTDFIIEGIPAVAGCTGTPVAGTATAATSNFCGNGATVLTLSGASSGTGISSQWLSSTDGITWTPIAAATDATYATPTLSTTTYYECITTCSSSGLADTSNIDTITITTPVTPSVNISSTDTTICAGTSVTFIPTPNNGGTAPVYQWTKNGNLVSAGDTYTDNNLADGDMITCVLTSNAACATPSITTSNTIMMTVNQTVIPTASMTVNPGDTVCSGIPLTYTVATTNGGATPTYQWTRNGVPVGSNENSYTDNAPVNNDVVVCALTSSAACAIPEMVSSAVTVTVMPSPEPVIAVHGDTMSTGAFSTYQWYRNGVAIPGANNEAYIITEGGNYTVSVTKGNNACTGTALTDTVNTLAIPTVTAEGGNVQVYPNPNTGTFTIEGNVNDSREAQIEVLDMVGQVVYQSTTAVQNGHIKQRLSLSAKIANGIYLLHIKTDNASSVIRFVVEK